MLVFIQTFWTKGFRQYFIQSSLLHDDTCEILKKKEISDIW
jgi:hypothetical protein